MSPSRQKSRKDRPRPEDAAPEIPGYQVFELIGRGGQGAVWRARQKSLDRVVAIKVLAAEAAGDATRARDFLREARLASRLLHPNILQAIDVGRSHDRLYFVMELVSGPNARALLNERGPLPEGEVLDIAWQVALALQYASERGVVHGDIKPENLVVSHDGTVKVVDFGIARLARDSGAAVMGTRGFVAPEVIAGCRPDVRADLYALGVTMYELLTGGLPDGDTDPRRHRSGVSPGMGSVVSRLLQPHPGKRYPSAAELIEALRRFPGFTPRAAATAPPRRHVRRRRVNVSQLIIVAVTLAVIIGGVAWLMRAGPAADPGDPGPAAPRHSEVVTGDVSPPEPRAPPPSPPPDAAPRPPPDSGPPDESPKPPTLAFARGAVDVTEGDELRVALEALHLPGRLEPRFEILDAEGRVLTTGITMPSFHRGGDSGDHGELRWVVPWITGHRPERRQIVAVHGVLQVKLLVRVAPGNRPPYLDPRTVAPVRVREGQHSRVKVPARDPDGDPLSLAVEAPEWLRVKQHGPLEIEFAAPWRAGHEVPEGTIAITVVDGHGGRCPFSVPASVIDVDRPSVLQLEARAPDLLTEPWTLVSCARTRVRATLRGSDPDLPEGASLWVEERSDPKPPGRVVIRPDGEGAFTLDVQIGPTRLWGPRNLVIAVGEEGRPGTEQEIRIQILRRTEAPKRPRGSLDRALDWLRRHQLGDGSLPLLAADYEKACGGSEGACSGPGSQGHAVGVTALAALAALRSGDGSAWVRRAVGFVAERALWGDLEKRDFHGSVYDHAIGAECLVTAWHLLGDEKAEKAARRVVRALAQGRNQGASQGWRYRPRDGESDASVTVWALRALVAARMAGLAIDESALAGGWAYLKTMTGANGRVGYLAPGAWSARAEAKALLFPKEVSEAMTAGSLSVMAHAPAGLRATAVEQMQLRLILECPPAWSFTDRAAAPLVERLPEEQRTYLERRSPVDHYYWQHATAALRVLAARGLPTRLRGDCRRYEKLLTKILEKHQCDEGCRRGSWDPAGVWGSDGGRAYATAILALALANIEFRDPLLAEFSP